VGTAAAAQPHHSPPPCSIAPSLLPSSHLQSLGPHLAEKAAKAPFLSADQFKPVLAWRAYASVPAGVELLFRLQAALVALEFPKSE
jgi:hypothetical protein